MSDPDPSPAASLFSVREVSQVYDISSDIELLLTHNAPQALLRDLHRPSTLYNVNPLEFDKHIRESDGGREAIRELKELIYASKRVAIHTLVPTRDIYRETIAERRDALSRPWADAPKFGTQYLPASMAMTWGQ